MLKQDVKEYMWEWLRQYINEQCIVRIPNWSEALPGRKPGTTYTWQFYLRRGLLNATFLNYVGYLFWDKYHELYKQQPFQIAGLETGSTPLLVGIAMTAPSFGINVNAISIRAKRKQYGLKNRMEGIILDLPVIVVDDISNSKETIELARKYCKEEGLTLLDQVFTVVHKNKHVTVDESLAINTFVHDNISYNAIFTLNDFNLSYLDYYRMRKELEKTQQLQLSS